MSRIPSTERWCGFNFGLWLSQSSLKPAHLDTFYKEEDIALLSDWGFNFVRLPVDYGLFENDDNPGVYAEKGLEYIDRAISWCSEYDVHVNLDMHELPGYGISHVAEDRPYEPELFDSKNLLRRSEKIWRMFSERYSSEGDNLSFNLLNEPIGDMSLYKRFVDRMISAIREIDQDRLIFVDGFNFSRIPVTDIEGENIIHSFHIYEPHWLTHYGADWAPGGYIYEAGCHIYEEPAKYPGVPPRMGRYLDRIPSPEDWGTSSRKEGAQLAQIREFFSKYAGVRIDKDWLEDQLNPWLEFRGETGARIHCGEFGVYAPRVDRESQLNWYRDILDIFKKRGIGWALWNLRGSFGVVEHGREEFLTERLSSGDRMDPELLQILKEGL